MIICNKLISLINNEIDYLNREFDDDTAYFDINIVK